MKLVELTVEHLELPLEPPFHANWDPVPRRRFPATVVRVTTDDGRTGIGGGDTLHGVDAYADRLLGTDPLAMERQVRVLETIDLHGPRPWPIEAALWDLYGQIVAQPVARLFGGASDRVAAYASTGAAKPPEAHAEVARDVRRQGFRAIKLRVDAHDPDGAVAEVAAVRDAVGSELEIMVDLNQAWRMPGDTSDPIDPVAARRILHALAELDVYWLEEPLLARDLAGLAALRLDGRVRIAGGEMSRGIDEVYDALDRDAFDVHQPDVVLAGGMWRGRTAAEVIIRRGRRYSPHTWTDGLGLLANLHVAAGVGGGPFLEFPYDPYGWTPERRDFPLAQPIEVGADGMLVVPDRPGLGIELDEQRVARTRIGGWRLRLDGDRVHREMLQPAADRPPHA